MRPCDRLRSGSFRAEFQTTAWSEVNALGGLDEGQRRTVLNKLMTAYWKPVYSYLRRRGYDHAQAEDLTQGFFHDIVLGRHLIEQAEATKGRFRTYLLTALDRYVVSIHRRQVAARRRPPQGFVPLGDPTPSALSVAALEMGPEEAFTYEWALDLLQQVLGELEKGCLQDGKEIHWRLFHARVLAPILTGEPAPPLAELCRELGVPTPVKAENMIVTVKRRFQAAMRDCVQQYVATEEEVEQEIHDLMEILSR